MASAENLGAQPGPLRWYDQRRYLLIWFIVFWPVALYGLVRSRIFSRRMKIVVLSAIPAFFVIVLLVLLSIVPMIMKSSGAYALAMDTARDDPRLIAVLGEPIEARRFVGGSISTSGPSGEAELAVPLSGPKNTADLYVSATKRAGRWELHLLEAEVDGDVRRIDLLTPSPTPRSSAPQN